MLREQLRKQKETSIEELPQLPDDTNDSIEEYEITERNRTIQDAVRQHYTTWQIIKLRLQSKKLNNVVRLE